MNRKQNINDIFIFDLSYHVTKQIALHYSEILYIEYHKRQIWLVDNAKNTYRLRSRSLNQLKKIFINEHKAHLFYAVRTALIPLHYISRLQLTEWNEETERILWNFIETNQIPLSKERLRDYFNGIER